MAAVSGQSGSLWPVSPRSPAFSRQPAADSFRDAGICYLQLLAELLDLLSVLFDMPEVLPDVDGSPHLLEAEF